MILSSIAFSIMAALVKKIGQAIPNQELVALRSLAALVTIFAIARLRGVRIRPKRPGLLLVRGLLGYSALSLWFVALSRLDLADAVMIQYSSPVWVALLAPLILKESSRKRDRVALVVAVIGVVLVVRPGLGLEGTGAMIGLTASVCSAFAYLAVRALRKHEHPFVLMLSFPAIASVISLGASARGWVWPDGDTWLLIAGVGVMTVIGQIGLTYGLLQEPAGRATVATYFAVVVSIILGILVFDQWPDPWMLAGGAMIVGSVASIALASHRPVPVPAGAGQAVE